MTPVKEIEPGVFAPIPGNPELTSIDGKVRAPLAVILHESWTAEDRSKFGVHLVEPAPVPTGKRAVGAPRYEKQGSTVVEVRDVEDVPPPQEPAPNPIDELRSDLEALTARVAVLEGKL